MGEQVLFLVKKNQKKNALKSKKTLDLPPPNIFIKKNRQIPQRSTPLFILPPLLPSSPPLSTFLFFPPLISIHTLFTPLSPPSSFPSSHALYLFHPHPLPPPISSDHSSSSPNKRIPCIYSTPFSSYPCNVPPFLNSRMSKR